MNIKTILKKIKYSFSKDNYTKYKEYGDLHWRLYKKGGWYAELVDDSLLPFKDVKRGAVLDVGSGDALVDSLLIKQGFSVEGVEPTQEGVAISKEKLPQMSVYQKTVEEFFSENKKEYDYLYSLNTIEHVKEYKVFEKLMGCVKNFAVIITDNAEVVEHDEIYHVKEFTYRELENLFSNYKTEQLFLHNNNFIGIKVYAK